jgi:hypothetical protein
MQQESNQTEQLTEPEPVSITTHLKPMKSSKAPLREKINPNHKLYGARVQAIRMALEQYGPQSRAELEQSAGIRKDLISAIVSRMNKNLPRIGKQIYVCRYIYDAEGSRRYPRAVYALGGGNDVPKPKASPKENKRRYDAKRLGWFRMNSVFNLGKSRDQIRAERKAA